jgi:transposase InsO family protein
MKTRIASPQRDRWAQLRFAIIGTLLAAPPAPRELRCALDHLAARSWRHPHSGDPIQFGFSTLERWYYTARAAQDPVITLRDRLRGDVGQFPSLNPRVIETLITQYREHPGWTAQLHHDNLRAALRDQEETLPSYPTIRRYLKAHGLFRQARPKRATAGALAARDRLERLEVRSYEVEYTAALWHLDFHQGSRKVLTRAGTWETPMLLGIIDDHSRLVCHLQWYLDETAESLVHGLCQAFMKRGLPRALMTDNGAAMVAEETTEGLAMLSVLHQTTLPYSPYQNGKQESFWGQIEGRLLPMLEGEEGLTLDALNRATQAWVEQEYHRTLHSEIGTTPLARHMEGPSVDRECPSAIDLSRAFRVEVRRRQRRSDGTVSLESKRFEIPSRYRTLPDVTLRYARWDLTRIDLVEPRTGMVLCPIHPLDKSAHADGVRRALAPAPDLSPLPASGMAPLLRQLLAEYAATGSPSLYLPKEETR